MFYAYGLVVMVKVITEMIIYDNSDASRRWKENERTIRVAVFRLENFVRLNMRAPTFLSEHIYIYKYI